ncbi:MAG: Holliday junction branch migration protein RuvA [Flavipsychrobacter sp.]|nr:Holliday junction branch migration protein RuvA [Flavipsychrobacter sp.]
MYAFIEGEIVYKTPSLLHVAVNGVGYEVNITLQTYDKIQQLEKCRLYTHIQVREDAWVMYGFADETERSTFRQLLGINGVGATTARIILSSLTPAELGHVIATEDSKSLEKVKGIGAKTAQRIILELKGKLQIEKNTATLPASAHNTAEEDALFALINLGIGKPVAEAALKKIKNTGSLTVEELIKQALKVL